MRRWLRTRGLVPGTRVTWSSGAGPQVGTVQQVLRDPWQGRRSGPVATPPTVPPSSAVVVEVLVDTTAEVVWVPAEALTRAP